MIISYRKMFPVDVSREGIEKTVSALSVWGFSSLKEVQDVALKRLEMGIITYIALHGEVIVGIGSIEIIPKLSHGGKNAGKIEDVAVQPAYQGIGIGKKLVSLLVQAGREAACYKITLDCIGKNVPFYEKCGFYDNCYAMRMDLE